MTVLVTGGNGFIGRRLVTRLRALGQAVRVLDLAEPPQPEQGVEYLRGSVIDPGAVRDAAAGVDAIYHLAAIPHLWARNDALFDRVNLGGTETVLAAARTAGTRRVLHCSSEAVLMPPGRSGRPVDERTMPAMAEMPGPYTRSKLKAENAARSAAGHGLDVVIVNPTIPVGAGDRNMTPPAAMLDLMLRGRSPFYLDCILNIVDVDDIAAGMMLAAERGRTGERYVLGNDAALPMRAMLDIVERVSGRPMPRRAVMPALALAAGLIGGWSARLTGKAPAATVEGVLLALRSAPVDCSKARRELGYEPRPVESALADAVLWLLHGRAAQAA